jgi:hypothetical protein
LYTKYANFVDVRIKNNKKTHHLYTYISIQTLDTNVYIKFLYTYTNFVYDVYKVFIHTYTNFIYTYTNFVYIHICTIPKRIKGKEKKGTKTGKEKSNKGKKKKIVRAPPYARAAAAALSARATCLAARVGARATSRALAISNVMTVGAWTVSTGDKTRGWVGDCCFREVRAAL